MASEHVVDVTAATFQTEVVEASMDRPVLVDFWADWCGPCKQLTPILEQLAEDYRGAFKLCKVDTDKERELAGSFRIQSIPTVAIVFGGRMLDQFQGALPKADLKRVLDSLLEQLNIPIPQADNAPTDPASATRYWQARLDKDAKDGEALLALGKLAVGAGNSDGAKALFEAIEAASPQYNAAQAALSTLGLLAEVAEAGGEATVRARLEGDPDDTEARYFVACADAGAGRFVAALDALVGLVATTRAEEKDRAKAAAATVFEAAGRDDPEIEALRRKLARLLF